MADVTRRRAQVPNGSMEVCLLQAFETMREEGVTWGISVSALWQIFKMTRTVAKLQHSSSSLFMKI